MRVEVSPDFIYPNMFLITGRAAGAMAPPVQPVGVLIVKQTVALDGTIPPRDQQEKILLTDVECDPPGPDDDDLVTYLEADLASYKPKLDIVAARNDFNREFFGDIRIDRNDGSGFQPNPPLSLDWGWQSRVINPRKAQAGSNLEAFTPDVNDPFKLPDGFENLFFNGSRIRTEVHLEAGNRVEFVEFGAAARRVTIPAGPVLLVTLDGVPISPTVSIELNCDTVVFDQTAGHYLVTWRAVFPWEDRLTKATLEVS